MDHEILQTATPYLSLGVFIFLLGWIRSVDSKLHTKTDKKYSDENFQTTKLCDERSGNIEKALGEIQRDVKTLLTK